MPKVSVYLPDELYRQVRERGVALSAVTQRAVEQELRRADLADWVTRAGGITPRLQSPVHTDSLLDEVRGEFGR